MDEIHKFSPDLNCLHNNESAINCPNFNNQREPLCPKIKAEKITKSNLNQTKEFFNDSPLI